MVGAVRLAKVAMVVGLLVTCPIGCGNSGGGGNSGSGAKCAADLECGRGLVCNGSKCAEVSCTSATDCGDGRLCVDGVCTGIECNTATPCPNGVACINGLCEGGLPTTGGTTGGETGGTTGGETGGTTGGTTGPPVVDTGACLACADVSECKEGLACTNVGPSKHCVAPCTTRADCTTGGECYGVGDVEKHCVPGLFQCKDCLTDGCGEALPWCNAASGACIQPFAACDVCENDGQCGPGARCWGPATQKHCVPECATAECPANGSCQDIDGGVQVCKWLTEGACCFGDECGGPPDPCAACGGDTPICQNEACVQCTNDTHCSGDKPKCQGNVCMPDNIEPPVCEGTTPHYDAGKDKCCQCLNSSHCNGNPCDPNTCQCKSGEGDVCSTCEAPYPGCAEFQGQWVCVQCSDDSHCPAAGSCSLENYTCEGGAPPATGNCDTAGCANPNNPNLLCDGDTGLCYDPEGNCDNVTMFCLNGGACLDFLSQLPGGGGGGGGLPIPLPEGGGLPGNCECELGAGEIEGISQGNCPDGLVCGPGLLGGLMKLFDPTAVVPNVCGAGLGGGLPFP